MFDCSVLCQYAPCRNKKQNAEIRIRTNKLSLMFAHLFGIRWKRVNSRLQQIQLHLTQRSFSSSFGIAKTGGRKGDAGFRVGDWICPTCHVLNYHLNVTCFTCKNKKIHIPEKNANKRRQLKTDDIAVNTRANKSVSLQPPTPPSTTHSELITQKFEAGDWICIKCSQHNFRLRRSCIGCGVPKPSGSADWLRRKNWRSGGSLNQSNIQIADQVRKKKDFP